MPTENDLEFGDIALQNKLLSKKQYEESIETLEKLEAKYKGKKGKKPRLVDVLVQLGYLSGQQAASVEKARNYRALRREDKLYARVAIKSKFATKKQIADGLEAQKQSYLKGKGKEPTRLPEWLNEKEIIDKEQDKAIREVLEKLDVSEYLASGKKKALKKPAKSESDSDDDAEELDEDDIEEVDDLELADDDDDKKKPAKKGSDSDSDDDEDEDSEPKKKPAAKKATDSDDVIELDGEDEVEEVDSNIENKLDEIDDEVAAEVKGSGIAKKGGAAKKPEPKKTSKSAQTDEDLPELELADDDDLKEPKKASAKAPAAKGGKKSGEDDISDLEDVDLDEIEEAEAKADEDDDDDVDIEDIDEIDLDDDEDESPKKKASGGKKK